MELNTIKELAMFGMSLLELGYAKDETNQKIDPNGWYLMKQDTLKKETSIVKL